jgi:hypothetical protein
MHDDQWTDGHLVPLIALLRIRPGRASVGDQTFTAIGRRPRDRYGAPDPGRARLERLL